MQSVYFKIVRFQFAQDRIDELSMANDPVIDLLSGKCQWGPRKRLPIFDEDPIMDVLESPPMLAMCDVAIDLRRYAESFSKKGEWFEDDVTEQYEFVATTAPESYDHDNNLHVCTTKGTGLRGVDERIVALEKERAYYQKGRYSSGLYGCRIL